MAKVKITPSLEKEIDKKFKEQSITIFKLLKSLEENPKKGKLLSKVADFAIKELKYKGFRFYFIVDHYQVNFLRFEELKDLLILFVRMSDKQTQQKTIQEIKTVLKSLGEEGFR